MKSAFLLWHTRELPEEKEETKLIGVYDTQEAAERAKERASNLPGFSASVEGFEISCYEVGKDHWREGFVTVTTKTPNQPPEPTAPSGRGSS